MTLSLRDIMAGYNPDAPLPEASTPPASWYIDPRVFDLEKRTVFSRSWHMIGRAGSCCQRQRWCSTGIFQCLSPSRRGCRDSLGRQHTNSSLSVPWMDLQPGGCACNNPRIWRCSKVRSLAEWTHPDRNRRLEKLDLREARSRRSLAQRLFEQGPY